MPSVPIFMPQLGESIAEATVVNLLVSPGDTVHADQEIIEVETQKATMAVTTLCAGTVQELRIEEGETYPVGHILGLIEATAQEVEQRGVDTLESSTEGNSSSSSDNSASANSASPAASPASTPSPASSGSSAPDQGKAHFAELDEAAPPSAEPDAPSSPNQVKPTVEGLPVPVHAKGAQYLSPRLKAKMEELGLRGADLANINGSGRNGRVTVEDLDHFLSYLDQYPNQEASPMRRAVADSMQRSWSRPLATVGLMVKMEPLLAHRKAQDPKPGVTLYAMRALGMALTEFPAAAGHLVGRKIFSPQSVDIGFAVEVPDGVLVPKIRQIEERPLGELIDDYRRLLELAQKRQLPEADQNGGVATVTNIGTFNLTWGTPIPPPTESLTMALCAAAKQPRWNEQTGQFEPSLEAELCLSFDHRVIDGGAAGRLLDRVRQLMESPEEL